MKHTKDLIEILRKEGHSVSTKQRKDGGLNITNIDGISFKNSEGNKQARRMLGEPLPSHLQNQREMARKFTSREEPRTNKHSIKVKQHITKTPKHPTLKQAKLKLTESLYNRYKETRKELKKLGIDSQYKTKGELIKAIRDEGIKAVRKNITNEKAFLRRSKSFKKEFIETQKEWNKSQGLKGKVKASTAIKRAKREGAKATRETFKQMTRYAQGYVNNKNLDWFITRLQAFINKTGAVEFNIVIDYCKTHAEEIKDEAMMKAYRYLYNLENWGMGEEEAELYADELIEILSY